MNRSSRIILLVSIIAASIEWQPAWGIFMPPGSTVWIKYQGGTGETGSNQAGLAPPNGIPLTSFPNPGGCGSGCSGTGTGYAEILPTTVRTLIDGFGSNGFMHASFQDTYTVSGVAAGPFDITVQLHVTGSMSGLTTLGQTFLVGGNVQATIGTFSPISEIGGVPLNEGFRVAQFDAGSRASAPPTGTFDLFGPGSIPVDITASYTKTGVNVGDVFDIGYQVRSAASRGQIDLRNGGTISFVLPDGVSLASALAESLLPQPGDYNFDGAVDAADYVVWRKTDSGNLQGYTDWRANFGEPGGSGSGASANTNVPEPATLVLFIVAVAASIPLRRRRLA